MDREGWRRGGEVSTPQIEKADESSGSKRQACKGLRDKAKSAHQMAGDMKEVEKLVSMATEVCNWLYNQRGMIAADLAKDLAKQISLAEKELKEVNGKKD